MEKSRDSYKWATSQEARRFGVHSNRVSVACTDQLPGSGSQTDKAIFALHIDVPPGEKRHHYNDDGGYEVRSR
jgi:hypothetical protein